MRRIAILVGAGAILLLAVLGVHAQNKPAADKANLASRLMR
jgi:hypothetical protein